jgi:hypothetical protein
MVCIKQEIAAVVVMNDDILNAVGIACRPRVSGRRRGVIVLEEGAESDLSGLEIIQLEDADITLEGLVIAPDRQIARTVAHPEREEPFAV